MEDLTVQDGKPMFLHQKSTVNYKIVCSKERGALNARTDTSCVWVKTSRRSARGIIATIDKSGAEVYVVIDYRGRNNLFKEAAMTV